MIAPRSSAISSPWRGEPLGRHLERMGSPRVGGGRYIAFQIAEVALPRSRSLRFCG
jgi:hypothetical protein